MTTVNELMEEIKTEYAKVFPESSCEVSLFYGSVYIKCYLSKDKTECVNSIKLNDMFNIHLELKLYELLSEDEAINESRLQLKKLSSYIVTRSDYKGLYCSYANVPFRVKEGNKENVMKYITRYFNNIRKTLKNIEKNNELHANYKKIALSK